MDWDVKTVRPLADYRIYTALGHELRFSQNILKFPLDFAA